MKMFKNALLFGGMLTTLALTSCLKGGNSASYTAIGTVAYDQFGNTVFYSDNDGYTSYVAENTGALEGYENARIMTKLDINYDNQTSNTKIQGAFSEIKKFNKQTVRDLYTPEDTLGWKTDSLLVNAIINQATVCVQQKRYYLNLNIGYLAQKENEGPSHTFSIYNNSTETNKGKDIYLCLVHDEGGELPGGKVIKSTLESFDITQYITSKEEKTQAKVYLTFYSSKGKQRIDLPFTNYVFQSDL